jgi:large subunit ribosomal protein L33
MAKSKDRDLVKLKSTESAHIYYTRKNRKKSTSRIERRKYDPVLRRHVVYRESR